MDDLLPSVRDALGGPSGPHRTLSRVGGDSPLVSASARELISESSRSGLWGASAVESSLGAQRPLDHFSCWGGKRIKNNVQVKREKKKKKKKEKEKGKREEQKQKKKEQADIINRCRTRHH